MPMMNRNGKSFGNTLKRTALAAICLLLASSTPFIAMAGGGPKPPAPPNASEDIISPICVACVSVDLGTNLYCTLTGFESGATIINAVTPCVPLVQAATSKFGIGCTDNRYRDAKLIGPRQQAATPTKISNGAAGSALGIAEDPLIEKEMDLGFQSSDGAPGSTINYDGVQGAMPNKTDVPNGMPHKDTPAMSIVMGYPWIWKETDQSVQYTLYRGTGNNTYADVDSEQPSTVAPDDDADTSASNNDGKVDINYIAKDIQCQTPKNTCTGSTDNDNIQYWTRLSRDSCTNQYLLPLALNPGNVFNEGYRNDAYSWNEQYCQPLITTALPCKLDLYNAHKGDTCLSDTGEDKNTVLDTLNFLYFGTKSKGKHNRYDYRAWGYLEKAWQDVLYNSYTPANSDSKDPNKLGGSSSTKETTPSNGPGKIYLAKPVDNFNQFGDPYNYSDPGSAPSGEGGKGSSGTYGYSATFTGKLTTIDELAQRPYERIFDSTHPFTPRWDMTGKTDRDLSNSTSIYQFGPIPDFWDGYSTLDIPGASGTGVGELVRCAAVPVDILTFRADEFNACMKCRISQNSSCFWDEYWENNIPMVADGEISDPATALALVVAGTSPEAPWGFFDDTRCKTTLREKSVPVYNQWGESGRWPPCSVSYDYPFDNRPGLCQDCVKEANDYSDNGDNGNSNKTSTKSYRLSGVTKCCGDLAQPVAPINILKIRNLQDTAKNLLANEGDPDRQVTVSGNKGYVPEGYRFSDYFPSGHMPYMRWWDTGAAEGGETGIPGQPTLPSQSATGPIQPENWNDPVLGTNYNPNCNKGKDDMIVGVGTETDGADGEPYGLCRFGGGGGKAYMCINTGVPKGTGSPAFGTNVDRLTSWYELKQYQVNAVRDFGLNCLPMQEKMWKWMGSEDGALYQAAKHFDSLHHVTNDITGATQTDSTNSVYEYKTNPWPLRWRGWLTDETDKTNATKNTDKNMFPNFDTGTSATAPASGSTFVGLDNAQRGDIIYITMNDAAGKPAFGIGDTSGTTTEPTTPVNANPVFPFIAVVTSAYHNGLGNTTANCTNANNLTSAASTECSDPSATCSDSIEVVDINNGKYPDVCGNTDYVGMGQTRTIYKEWLPPPVQDALYGGGTSTAQQTDSCNDTHTISTNLVSGSGGLKISAEGNCMDPKYSQCTFSTGSGNGAGAWDTINVYRPSLDERGHTAGGGSR